MKKQVSRNVSNEGFHGNQKKLCWSKKLQATLPLHNNKDLCFVVITSQTDKVQRSTIIHFVHLSNKLV